MTTSTRARAEHRKLLRELEDKQARQERREADVERRIEREIEQGRRHTAKRLEKQFARERAARARFIKALAAQIEEAAEEAKAEQAAEDAEIATEAMEREAAAKRLALRRWISEGGTEEQFEQAWPALWQERLKAKTAGAPDNPPGTGVSGIGPSF